MSNSDSTDPYTSTLLDTLMSSEQERFNTFARWPDDVPMLPVSARSLAQAGFYVNREANTRCFACGLCVDNWREGDIPMERHRQERPACEVVMGDQVETNDRTEEVDNRVGTVAQVEEDVAQMIGNHLELAEDIPREMYQFEEMRVQSFLHWPVPDIVSPTALARAGFYSLNPSSRSSSDSVQCAFCEGAVGSWERGDCPDREHRRHFPMCPFVLGTINPRLERLEGGLRGDDGRGLNVRVVDGGVQVGNLQELGVHTHTAPRKPRFTSLSSRLSSFTGWPPHLIQTPQVLAEAGFYYEHPSTIPTPNNNQSNTPAIVASDHVRCFHCDGGLKHWDPHDDPWTEHARWFPQCSYVLLVKGAEFVVAAASRHGAGGEQNGENRQSTTTSSTTPSTIPALPCSSNSNTITDRELQSHLQAPAALEALSLGIVVERVKQAIKDKLERTGTGFRDGATLIEAALNLQRDEDLEARAASGGDGRDRSVGRDAGETGVSDAFFQILKQALDVSIPIRNPHDDTEESSEEPEEHVLTPTRTPAKDTRLLNNQNQNHNMTVLNSTRTAQQNTPKAGESSSTQKSVEAPTTKEPSSNSQAASSSTVKLSLEEENRILKEARLCKICMDSEVGIVFLPCGHLATCVQCAPNLQACPVCRSSIRATVRTFLS